MQYVYLLRAGENHYKVGVAKNMKNRLAGLQTSNPTKIQVVSTKLLDDAYAVERELHVRLKQWNVSGEWFQLEPQEVINLLIKLNDYPEPNLAMNVRLRDILAEHGETQKRIEKKLSRVVELANRNTEIWHERLTQPKLPEQVKLKELPLTDSQLIERAIPILKEHGKASTSFLQRKMRLGYGRAARLLELLEEQGIVSAADGSRARQLL